MSAHAVIFNGSPATQLATSPLDFKWLQKIVLGYNSISHCSPAGYKKSEFCSEQYQ